MIDFIVATFRLERGRRPVSTGGGTRARDSWRFGELARDVETVARILERVDRNLRGAANGAHPSARINDSLVNERLADSQWTLEQVTALERKCRSDEGRAIRPFLELLRASSSDQS